MASFKTAHIAILFQLILGRSGREPRFSEFKGVSEDIGNASQMKSIDVSPEYLNKQHNLLTKALNEGKQHIGLKPAYVDACCQYLGFKTHTEFQSHCDKIMGCIEAEKIESENVQLYYSEDDRQYIFQKLEQCFYPGQVRSVDSEAYKKTTTSFLENILKLSSNGSLVVLCLPQEEEISEEDHRTIVSFFKSHPKIKNVISLLPEGEEENDFGTKAAFPEAESFPTVIALTNQMVQNLSHVKSAKETSHKGRTINVQGDGSVVMGDLNIKGEYVSQGDMHITIQNKPQE